MEKNNSLQGKIILVTGATNGIGKVTARELAKMGATTVVAGRNPEKTARTVMEIREASGNPAVDMLVGDLSSQVDVRRLAAEFRQRYDPVERAGEQRRGVLHETGRKRGWD